MAATQRLHPFTRNTDIGFIKRGVLGATSAVLRLGGAAAVNDGWILDTANFSVPAISEFVLNLEKITNTL